MNETTHLSEDDLMSLALQFVPEKDMPDARAHLAQCASCCAELGRLQGDLALYALTVDPHSPPAYARERLLSKVAKEKLLAQGATTTAAGEPLRPWWHVLRSPRAGWAFAGAFAALALVQFAVYEHTRSQLDEQTAQIAQINRDAARAQGVLQALTDSRSLQVGMHLTAPDAAATGKKTPEAHAAYVASSGALVFFASNLAPLQPYKTYELWLLPSNGRDPIAAGIFKPDSNGSANIVMPNIPKGVPASGFGITIEDEGGAKQPTPPVMMAGS